MKWTDINEQLPPDTEKFTTQTYLVTVTGCSNKPKTLVMDWECPTIRGKVVKRWTYRDRLLNKNWKVTHWMKLPEPAIN